MKIDTSKELVQFNGKAILDVDENGNQVPATVKTALVNAVLQAEQNEKGIQKIQKYELAKRIYQSDGEVELTAEEVVLLKRRVEELYAPLIVGQLVEILR